MGLSPRCRLLGLVGKHFPLCLRLPYFKAFGFSPSLSTLGSWGYPLVVDFWAKFSPLVFACLISRLFGFSPSYLPWAHGAIPQM